MMRHSVLLLVTAVLGAGLTGCPQGRECREVMHFVEELDNSEELRVRDAIRGLSGLADSVCIGAAIDPLAAVLADSSDRHDLFTRSLAAPALAKIAHAQADWEEASRAAAPLVDAMFHHQSDLLRSQAALSLGDCGWEEVLPSLRAAAASDRSELVRAAAASAAGRFTGAAPLSRSASALTASPVTAGPAAECIPAGTKDFMDRHLIVLRPDLAQLPVCEP